MVVGKVCLCPCLGPGAGLRVQGFLNLGLSGTWGLGCARLGARICDFRVVLGLGPEIGVSSRGLNKDGFSIFKDLEAAVAWWLVQWGKVVN